MPLLSVLLLLALKVIHRADVRNGIIGADGVKPINIMALFISLVSSMTLNFMSSNFNYLHDYTNTQSVNPLNILHD